MRSLRGRILLLTVMALLATYNAAPGSAAVRVCTGKISSELTRAPVQRDAHREAIASWTARAKAAGIAHPAWRLAADKLMKCLPSGAEFECLAMARACTIEHKAPAPARGPKRDI